MPPRRYGVLVGRRVCRRGHGGGGRGAPWRGGHRPSRRCRVREPAPSARVVAGRRFLGLAAPLRAGPGALGGDVDTRAAVRAQSSSAGLKGLDVQLLSTPRAIESDAHFTTPTDVLRLEPSPAPAPFPRASRGTTPLGQLAVSPLPYYTSVNRGVNIHGHGLLGGAVEGLVRLFLELPAWRGAPWFAEVLAAAQRRPA